jgi:hypothetical protein
MSVQRLREWLCLPRTAFIHAVASDVRAHVEMLKSRGADFYGYALHPGELYDIHGLVSVTNAVGDIKIPQTDGLYGYYRYCVDEWRHWHREGFVKTDGLLSEANEQFRSMHSKTHPDCMMDEFEVAHANALLKGILEGFGVAKAAGVFGSNEPFLVVWAPNHEILVESARELNSNEVAAAFETEFG